MRLTNLKKASKAELMQLIEHIERQHVDRARFRRNLEWQLSDIRVKELLNRSSQLIAAQQSNLDARTDQLTAAQTYRLMADFSDLCDELTAVNKALNHLQEIP